MSKVLDVYPELRGYVHQTDFQPIGFEYCRPLSQIEQEVRDYTCIRTLGERSFRAFFEPGESDETLLVAGEFANGLSLPVVTRAQAIRSAVMPEASLAILPNDSFRERNLDFSREENAAVSRGDAMPYVDRIRALVGEDSSVTVFGPSQGAVIGAAFASHPDTNVQAFAAVEAPNVVDRSVAVLTRDFGKSGAFLSRDIELNVGSRRSELVAGHISSLTLAGRARYAIGALSSTNRATVHLLNHATLANQLEALRKKKIGISLTYAELGRVSPGYNNRLAVRNLLSEGYKGYSTLAFEGITVGHSLTNVALIGVAATRLAREAREAAA